MTDPYAALGEALSEIANSPSTPAERTAATAKLLDRADRGTLIRLIVVLATLVFRRPVF